MKYGDFIGKVQNRARLGTQGETVRATRATLEVLGKRLYGGEAKDLATQLPAEIGVYLKQDSFNETFDLKEFYQKVSETEGVDLPVAIHHARSVVSVIHDAVSAGEMEHVRAQLTDDYEELFDAEIKDTN